MLLQGVERKMAVIIEGDNIFSAIGTTTAENIASIKEGISGIRKVEGNLPGNEDVM